MADFYDFNATFFLSLATMVFGCLAGALGYALKSKCISIKCCGCVEIIRDVELEAELEVTPLQQPLQTEPTTADTSSSLVRTKKQCFIYCI